MRTVKACKRRLNSWFDCKMVLKLPRMESFKIILILVKRTNLSISFANEYKFMVFFQKTCNTLAAGFQDEIKYLF